MSNQYYRMLILLESEEPLESNKLASADNTDTNEQCKPPTTTLSHEYLNEFPLEFLLIGEDHMDELNKWFDKFDAEICIPNEKYIKYEITSDGLIVVLVKNEDLVNDIECFVKKNDKEQ
ncbi:uncharacterized protein SCDLUD_001277 [Saccharomycodes ludwigii]|uniref:uncharacterized protein n=1 Tax=Saccharomycodes ludwigii TaxID=36035 RepID=UPI001E850240|nr:hypothetical protein SCDLUD_001277 [Saccharomycodes ludwigii]KAH3903632.1 hypothetical protein SCDLUD_001277 [Saccharomycodes ludwigii]